MLHFLSCLILRKVNFPWCILCIGCTERRVVALRTQIEELKSELSAANAELEDAKRSRELVEQELRGCEVQLYLSEASVQTLEVS